MGGLISVGWKRLISKKEKTILVTGTDAAGKTTLLHALGSKSLGQLNFYIEAFEWNGIKFIHFDINVTLSKTYKWALMSEYIFDGVIFVIDAADHDRIEEVKEEFDYMIEPKKGPVKIVPPNIPILIFANKKDLYGRLDTDSIIKRLELYDLHDRKWHIEESSFCCKEGIDEGMEWLMNNIT